MAGESEMAGAAQQARVPRCGQGICAGRSQRRRLRRHRHADGHRRCPDADAAARGVLARRST
jgi:hypothetical protein